MRETSRQTIHIIIGIFFLFVLNFYSRRILEMLLFGGILMGFLAMNFIIRGKRIPVFSDFVEKYERGGSPLPGYGSAWYAIGVLAAALFIKDVNQLSAAICLIALGDGFATIAGKGGKFRLPYNKGKTLEGTLAFFLASLSSWIFIGPLALPLAALGAIVESLPIPIDDNLTIPAIAILFFTFI